MKRTALLLFFMIAVGLSSVSGADRANMGNGRVLMIVAPKMFRDEELFVPKRIFMNLGFKVVVASTTRLMARGMLGGKVHPDLLLRNVNVSDYKAVVFVGGSGATVYYNNKLAWKIARVAVEKRKVLAAICLAPGILANAGLLKGVKSTAFRTALPLLSKKGAECSNKSLIEDAGVITANGPSVAADFARLIVKAILRDSRDPRRL